MRKRQYIYEMVSLFAKRIKNLHNPWPVSRQEFKPYFFSTVEPSQYLARNSIATSCPEIG